MRWSATALCVGFFVACSTWAVGKYRAWSSEPRAVCEAPDFDFGEVGNDQIISHTFLIQNGGGTALTVSDVQTDCGCSAVEAQVPVTLEPGADTCVTVRMSLRGRRGSLHRRVLVQSDDPSQPTLVLNLRGQAVSPVTVTPDRVSFDGTDATAEPVRTLVVSSLQPVRITRAAPESPQLRTELRTVEDGHRYEVRVTLRDPAAGAPQGVIYLLTDYEPEPEIRIPVDAVTPTVGRSNSGPVPGK